MRPASAAFLEALRHPQTFAVQATLLPAAGGELELDISDGTVTSDRMADIRGHLTLTAADAALYPSATSDPVNVYGAEIRIRRGLRFAGAQTELIDLGIFRVEDIQRDQPAGTLQITGWDRARQIQDERFLKPRRFNSMAAIDLIEQLITEVDPTAQFDVTATDIATTIPKHVVERDRWAEAKRVAQIIGCEVYPDGTGRWQIRDVPDPATATTVFDVDAGPSGVLVTTSDRVTRDGVPNIVVATGDGTTGNNAPIYGIARDTNPLSPTYYLGPYGQVPRFFTSQHIRTQAQADRVAAAQLADHLGATRTVDFTAVPNPALEASDAIRIAYPDGTIERHLIDALDIGLSPSGAMAGGTRALDWDAA